MATNEIVLENEKPGNPASEWMLVNGPYSNIEGFATNISVNVGEEVDFKINTDSTHYRIDIYRLGYYGGDGARLVASIEHNASSPTAQPSPEIDLSTGVVDAGNWSVTDAWHSPSDSISGVYIAKLVREDGVTGENHITFIIRDDSSNSDIIYQTADETWQAYNTWGGSSLYSSNVGNPQLGDGDSYVRAYGVSYNRPFENTSRENGSVLGQDYRAIYWLEQNGYDVTYQSGLDTAVRGDLLLNHEIFMDSGHDEYWSGDQRANVEAARDAGVNLVFTSGNLMYWKTRWEPGIDGASNRTLISYKESTDGAKIDPSPEWTGQWRDPNSPDGAMPENALTGTLFKVNGDVHSLEISFDYSQYHLWANTQVAGLQPGQSVSLTNLLGYEWDVDADNGFRPAGLIDLSSTTVYVSALVSPDSLGQSSGDATHSLTLYRAPSGALVFSAGSIYFSYGLAPADDPTLQQFMVNLFAEMGVQPATLQAGLVPGDKSTDFTPPETTIWSLNSFAGSLVVNGFGMDSGGGVVAGTEISTDGGNSWHPTIGSSGQWLYSWAPAGTGNITVLARSVDDSVNLGVSAALPIELANIAAGTAQVATLNAQVAAFSDPSSLTNSETPVYAIVGGGDADKFNVDSQTGSLSFISPPDYSHPTDFNGDNVYEIWVSSTGSWDGAHPFFVTVTPAGGSAGFRTTILSLNASGDSFVVGGIAASSADGIVPGTEVSIDGGITWQSATGTGNWNYWWTPNQPNFTILARSTDHSIDSSNPAALGVEFDTIVAGNSYVTTVGGSSNAPSFAIIGGGDAFQFNIDSHTGVLSFNSAPDYAHPTDLGGNNIYELWVTSTGGWDAAHPVFVRVTPGDGVSTLHTTIFSLNEFNGSLILGGTSGDFDGGVVSATEVSTDGGLTWQTALGTGTWNYYWQPAQTDFTVLARAVNAGGNAGPATALKVDLDSVAAGGRYVTTVADENAGSGVPHDAPTFAIVAGGDADKFSIDSLTGVLSFNSTPDYTHPIDLGGDNVYELWVTSTGSWSGAHPLFVTVTPAVQGQTLTGDSSDNSFYASATPKSFSGQGGSDTVSYIFASGAVTASLANSSTNTGDAANDSYSSIENLIGSSFDDTLTGDNGANMLQGGLGADLLAGGQGNDVFVYRSAAEGGDTIQDFAVTDDTLSISASGFGGGLVAGQHLVAGMNFIADDAPTATADIGTFLYNTLTHDLFWDVDGSGGGATVQIAHFANGVVLTADHFDIAA